MLLSNSVSEAESARLKVLQCQLSNNMELALELREELTDAQVVAIVTRLARRYTKWMRSLLSSEQPTVAATEENLVAAAMHRLDVELADQLLIAGENPNMPIDERLPKSNTPSREADTTSTSAEHDLSPLELACGTAAPSVNESALSTVSELVADGATIDRAADRSRPTALLLAVRSGNADLVGFILESGAEVDSQYRPPDAKSLKLNPSE
ncbi:hypothetical protein DL765_011501 [Monosporascus sp. GIB2]|nr:hypothetical protein DL765_011501 [Monosporascus sp. GIB2]